MKKMTRNRTLFSLLLAGELTVMADMFFALLGKALPMAAFLLLFFACLTLLFCLKELRLPSLRRAVLGLTALVLALLLGVFGQLFFFASSARYGAPEEGKEALFGGRDVMVIAPHEDDELSMLGGTLEAYVRYGSTVRLVFVTNGDLEGNGEERMREALEAADFLGIPREQVIFLGYGDGWYLKDDLHLYNVDESWVAQSVAERTESYGLPEHPAWREGESYTRRNLYESIRDVILEYRPQLIFTTAYEPHADHRATALLVEEAMAEILAREADYAPLLLESISYHSSYFGAEDFYSPNSLAVPNPFDTAYNGETHVFNWADRLRLPVDGEGLSRSLLSSRTWQALSKHRSQGCNLRAVSIVSGDTVFWQRPTDSLSYRSQILVSSGDGEALNNFKLLDSSDIKSENQPFEDLWLPAAADGEKTVTVRLQEPAALTAIYLYDNPSLTDNVLNARICLDNGRSLESGPLAANGSAAVIPLEGEVVESFTVQLLESEGEQAGLSELECYGARADYGLDFIKLQNARGDFVYDYYIDESGSETFTLYPSGKAPALDSGEYSLVYSGDEECRASFEGEGILVQCPKGKSLTLSIRSADGRYGDMVHFSNPGAWARRFGQAFEQFCLDGFYYGLRNSVCYTTLYKLTR